MVGVFSGMNDAGLAVASNEVFAPQTARTFNPKGVPFPLLYRRVLEECATADEALALIRKAERATSTILVVCDRDGGAVFEVTPDRVERRPVADGVLACTNHFLSRDLVNPDQPNSYQTLDRFKQLGDALAKSDRLSPDGVRQLLHAVNQKEMTVQTMVFEPAALRLHLSIGKGPTSARELRSLDLKPLFEGRGR
jgi:predicted choloylglycine hydrolase